MVIAGALIEDKDLMSQQLVLNSLGDILKRKNLVELNQNAILKGAEFIKLHHLKNK